MPNPMRSRRRPGSTFTKRVTRGPNKGDLTRFKVARGGKPFPVAVLQDRGRNSTLRDNSGVRFPKR